ncbi:MAG: hypothetical protein HYU86_02760 [Chloroflexi bacterium]|nr:hypothetical protein [Chloroflexota bacterium]
MAAAVAAILYAKYAYDLANVTEQTRMDGHRPIVIPANWGKCIQNKYTVRKSVLDERQEDYPYLKVRNVGVGPALNIYLRLNRSRPDQGENKPELLVDPSRSSVRHLAAGDEEYAVQWGADVGQSMVARDIDLQENDILIIAYDDLFKRPFESSYKRVQGKWMWQGDKTPERQWPHAVKDSSGL